MEETGRTHDARSEVAIFQKIIPEYLEKEQQTKIIMHYLVVADRIKSNKTENRV